MSHPALRLAGLLAFTSALAALGGCAAPRTTWVNDPVAFASAPLAAPQPAAGVATVVVFRRADDGAAAAAGPINVYVDNRYETSLLPGGATSWTMCAQATPVALVYDDAAQGHAGRTPADRNQTLAAGSLSYFEATLRDGKAELKPSDAATALAVGAHAQIHTQSRVPHPEQCRPVTVAAAAAPPVAAAAAGATRAPAHESHSVYFGFGATRLGPVNQARVAELARKASASGMQVQVTGHADPVGSAAANQRISERRAAHTRSLLVRDGVPAAHVQAKGRSYHDLRIKGCKGAHRNACNQPNRRADVTLVPAGK